MFPDLTRDDVFRLETARLWLRWPRVADAAAITRVMGEKQVAEMTATWPYPLPDGEAERRIFQMRKTNALGAGLQLVMALKENPNEVVGIVGGGFKLPKIFEIGYALDPDFQGEGLATEAVQALLDAAFTLTEANEAQASVRVMNDASRRVLEKSGFQGVGSGLDNMPARGGRLPADHFRLGRRTWSALKGWRSPIIERLEIDVGINALEAGVLVEQQKAKALEAFG